MYKKFKVVVRQDGKERTHFDSRDTIYNYKTFVADLLDYRPGHVYVRNREGFWAHYELQLKGYGIPEITCPKM